MTNKILGFNEDELALKRDRHTFFLFGCKIPFDRGVSILRSYVKNDKDFLYHVESLAESANKFWKDNHVYKQTGFTIFCVRRDGHYHLFGMNDIERWLEMMNQHDVTIHLSVFIGRFD